MLFFKSILLFSQFGY